MYMAILEVLRDAPGYRYNSDPKLWAFILHGADVDLVSRVLQTYGLFNQDDDGLLFSPWLNDQLSDYTDKKAKLQEAGRRGAAKRWAAAHASDGQAIASPSVDDGQAIAYNVTPFNITKENSTQSNPEGGEDWRKVISLDSRKVDVDYIDLLSSSQPSGHSPGYIAQVCMHFGMTEAVCDFICERSNNAEIGDPIYNKFCALVRRINQEKWVPNHPANFFLSKLFG